MVTGTQVPEAITTTTVPEGGVTAGEEVGVTEEVVSVRVDSSEPLSLAAETMPSTDVRKQPDQQQDSVEKPATPVEPRQQVLSVETAQQGQEEILTSTEQVKPDQQESSAGPIPDTVSVSAEQPTVELADTTQAEVEGGRAMDTTAHDTEEGTEEKVGTSRGRESEEREVGEEEEEEEEEGEEEEEEEEGEEEGEEEEEEEEEEQVEEKEEVEEEEKVEVSTTPEEERVGGEPEEAAYEEVSGPR